ncbi:MAG TPA: alpha/beta hydrolase [Lapillicoccus sp.]|uniref:alpha/beta hydrolase n=1 Tax=Lapillicoccus sp. TaxID=1909287 RepID=UPI002F9479D9
MPHNPARAPSLNLQSPRRLLILATAAVAALVSVVFTIAAPAQASTPRPTIVLVHGAFSGSSAWNEVAAGLRKDGYTTVAPALTLSGLSADVATVRAALDATPGPKIVVGHSYGGLVVSNAATGRADVVGLVFTAAFLPDDGDTIVGLGTGYAPASFLAPGHLVVDQNGVATITPANYREDFAQDLNPKLAGSMAAAQTPTSLSILFTPSGPPAWRDLPSWYAVSGADRVIDPALQRAMATRAGSTVVTFDDASHSGGFTHYSSRFVKLVEKAATSR